MSKKVFTGPTIPTAELDSFARPEENRPTTVHHPRDEDAPGSSLPSVRDGWLDRLVDLPDRLPGPSPVWFAALFTVVALLGHLPTWIAGESEIGTVVPYAMLPAAVFAYFLAVCHLQRRVARTAFVQFEPALGQSPAEHARLAIELIRIPSRASLVAIVLAILLVLLVGTQEAPSDIPPVANAATWVLWLVAVAALAVTVTYTLHQMQWISRLHSMASAIDLFEPSAINALSRLTVTSGLSVLLVALLFLVGDQPAAIGAGLVLVIVAIATFVLPLRGMHERQVTEKRRLLAESATRLKETLAWIHGSVDAKDLAQADQLQKTLSSLLAEREVVSRLPTWPWSPGTLRGFATAAVLPIGLWLVIRLLEQFL